MSLHDRVLNILMDNAKSYEPAPVTLSKGGKVYAKGKPNLKMSGQPFNIESVADDIVKREGKGKGKKSVFGSGAMVGGCPNPCYNPCRNYEYMESQPQCNYENECDNMGGKYCMGFGVNKSPNSNCGGFGVGDLFPPLKLFGLGANVGGAVVGGANVGGAVVGGKNIFSRLGSELKSDWKDANRQVGGFGLGDLFAPLKLLGLGVEEQNLLAQGGESAVLSFLKSLAKGVPLPVLLMKLKMGKNKGSAMPKQMKPKKHPRKQAKRMQPVDKAERLEKMKQGREQYKKIYDQLRARGMNPAEAREAMKELKKQNGGNFLKTLGNIAKTVLPFLPMIL